MNQRNIRLLRVDYIGNEIIHVTDAFLVTFKQYLEERKP